MVERRPAPLLPRSAVPPQPPTARLQRHRRGWQRQRPDGQRPDAHYPIGPFAPTDDFGPPHGLGADKSDLGAPQAAFTASTPAVSGISPASGPTSGGQWVAVRGTNLSGATAVDFGRLPAPRVNAISATELRALTPAHPAGHVDVVVKGPAGRSEVSPADRYSFAP